MKCVVCLLASIMLLLGGCAVSIPPEETIVTVNGTPIREKQVAAETDKRMAVYIAQEASQGMLYDESSEKATRASMRDDVLHSLIERILIAEQLKVDQIEISDADIDAYFLNRVMERGKTLQEAEQDLKAQGKSRQSIQDYLRYNAMGVEELYNLHAKNKRELTEAEVQENYEANLVQFVIPEQRRVSHILIAATPDTPESFRADTRAKAEKLLQRIRAGEDFAKLAETYSQDNLSRSRGGDRGWSSRGLLADPNNDPFGKVMFAMQNIGDISEVIGTMDGFQIGKLTGIKNGRLKSFQEAQWEMMEDFKMREIRGFWFEYGDMLWKKAKIEWSPAEKIRMEKEEKRLLEFNRKMDLQIEQERQRMEKTNTPKSP